MTWITPKTNWTPADGFKQTDINRIEGNVQYLYDITVPITGGTMAGPLILVGDPAAAKAATPKQYVDAQIALAKTYAP